LAALDLGEFDFVIFGAGCSGCVLSNRLSGGRHHRVALLEAGGRTTSFFVRMPISSDKIVFDPGLS